MSDDLVKHLRNSKGWPTLGNAAADRIEELEAKLAKLKYSNRYWLGEYDVVLAGRADANDRIEELEAKLAKAVETLKRYGGVMPVAFAPIQDGGYKARTTLAELTGETK